MNSSISCLQGQQPLISLLFKPTSRKILNEADENDIIKSSWMSNLKQLTSSQLSDGDVNDEQLQQPQRFSTALPVTMSSSSHRIMEPEILPLSTIYQNQDEQVNPELLNLQLGINEAIDILRNQELDSNLDPNLSFSSAPTTIRDAATLCEELEYDSVNCSKDCFECDQQKPTARPELIPSVVTSAIPLPPKEGDNFKPPIDEKQKFQLNESRAYPQVVIGHTPDKSKRKQERRIQAFNQDQSEANSMPSRFDILCGQSKNLNKHPGNRRFQVILDMYTPRYRKTTNRQDRMLITKEIMACIRSSGGRFLKINKGVYTEISSVMARDKISHALRNRI